MKECMEPSGAKSQPLSRSKKCLLGAMTVLLACLVIMGWLEILLRLLVMNRVAAEANTPLQQSTIPGLNYELIANHQVGTVRTGPDGLRPREHEATVGDFRILLVGDSIAYGMGVKYEESLAPVLENELDRLTQRPNAVWNAAVPGYNTEQEALRAGQVVPIVRPNLILVQFCMNDYEGAARLAADGILEVSPGNGQTTFSMLGLVNQSRALLWIKNQIRDLQQSRPEWFPVWAHYIHRVSGKPGWSAAKEALLKIEEVAKAADARLLVVIFPVEQQLRIGDRSAQDDLVTFATKNQINTLDLYPSFRQHWQEGLYVNYWGHTGTVDKLHPNARGHRLAASEIAKVLSTWSAERIQ